MNSTLNLLNGSTVVQPNLKLIDQYPDAFGTGASVEENHEKLLDYLKQRLESGTNLRTSRIVRYGLIDKVISTWQVLSEQDSTRRAKEESTGQAQATSLNLPITHTHIDDMVSFFAQVYAPAAGDFFQMGEPSIQEAVKPLVQKLNSDAKAYKYYKNLCATLRSLLKYNIGGVTIEWKEDKKANCADSIDMYNFMWDPDITDPSCIAKEAEWAAIISHRNPMWIARKEAAGEIRGAYAILDPEAQPPSNGRTAEYYRYPPIYAGLSYEDQKTSVGGRPVMDWGAYGAGLSGDSATEINGHEVIDMYCWLNPRDFELTNAGAKYEQDGYYLWKFTIIDMHRIVQADPVLEDATEPSE